MKKPLVCVLCLVCLVVGYSAGEVSRPYPHITYGDGLVDGYQNGCDDMRFTLKGERAAPRPRLPHEPKIRRSLIDLTAAAWEYVIEGPR